MQREVTDFTFAKEVRLFGLKNWLTEKYSELKKERLEVQKRNERLWFIVAVISNVITTGAQLFVYIYLIYAVSRGEVTIGDFTLYVASSTTMFNYLNNLLGGIADLFERSRQADDFRSFMDYDDGSGSEKAEELPRLDSYEFEFKNVSFKSVYNVKGGGASRGSRAQRRGKIDLHKAFAAPVRAYGGRDTP